MRAQIAAVATVMSPNRFTIDQIAEKVISESGRGDIPVHAIRKLTGVEGVFHCDDGQNPSDFATAAAQIALDRAGYSIEDIDLLLFSSAGQDLIEPATSHIVANMLGAKSLPVFDVKNACNSFLNGLQVANAFIQNQTYRRVLVVSGEAPSMAIRWKCESKEQFMQSFAGYSMTDGGAAVVLTASSNPEDGIQDIQLTASSDYWNIGMLRAGGSRGFRDPEATFFDMDGRGLAEAFLELGPEILNRTLAKNKLAWQDFPAIGMHQVSAKYLSKICNVLGVPRSQLIETISYFGNVTSLSLPLQLERAIEGGRLSRGDLFAFIGLAGGISTGLGIMRI